MNVGIIGISHKNAPVEIREQFAFTSSKKNYLYDQLLEKGFEEVIILSTCNRSEIYVAFKKGLQAEKILKKEIHVLSKVKNLDDYFYYYDGENALKHLYSVTCGLDSIVIGEDQILGQVKHAMDYGIEHRQSGKILNKCFREAVTFSKKMKTIYKISENPLSVSSIAMKFVKQQLGTLKGKKVFLIGMGKMGQLLLDYLYEEGEADLYVSTRSHHNCDKYVKLLEEYPKVTGIPMEERLTVLNEMDAVFCQTGSPHVVLDKEDFKNRDKSLVVMDIAVPRDVDKESKDMPFVKLFDVDDLKRTTDDNLAHREKIACLIRTQIEEEVVLINHWIQMTKVDPMIAAFNDLYQSIYQETLENIDKTIELSANEQKKMQKIIKASLKKMVNNPIKNLKSMDNIDEVNHYTSVVNHLYGFGGSHDT